MDKRPNLGTHDRTLEEKIDAAFSRPYLQMGELPPDPGYTAHCCDNLVGNRPTATMNPDLGDGDLKEGLSLRTRMPGQFQKDELK
jgi:hypothetical protein